MNLIWTQEKPELIEEPQESNSLTAPKVLEDLGLSETFLSQLILKQCFYLENFTIKDLAERLKLNFTIIQDLVSQLIHERCLEVRSAGWWG